MKNDRIGIMTVQHGFQVLHTVINGPMNAQQAAQPLVSGRNGTGRHLHGSLQHAGWLEIRKLFEVFFPGKKGPSESPAGIPALAEFDFNGSPLKIDDRTGKKKKR